MARPTPQQPRPGQESVWDYPRPPRVEADGRRVEVVCDGVTVIDTTDAVRVLETSHPPTWYLPVGALRGAHLRPTGRTTACEYKGRARYFDIVADDDRVLAAGAAWGYPHPTPGYEALADRFTVHPDRVHQCRVDGQPVQGQAGGFYGGWITDDIVGPFKGEPGTLGW